MNDILKPKPIPVSEQIIKAQQKGRNDMLHLLYYLGQSQALEAICRYYAETQLKPDP